jgi:NADPH:quinone reductase-like Zn-dependent oxidoreductase
MRAAVIEVAGGPEVLKLQERPVPKPETGWALVRVKAFGINRSELFTRQGHSPSVLFPRILGIEAVGQAAISPGGEFPKGQTVATAMGGMGRQFDGSYAEYTCVPASQVQALETKVDWGPRWRRCRRCCRPPGDRCIRRSSSSVDRAY